MVIFGPDFLTMTASLYVMMETGELQLHTVATYVLNIAVSRKY